MAILQRMVVALEYRRRLLRFSAVVVAVVACSNVDAAKQAEAGALRVRVLAVGTDHVCGIGTTGITYCWGSDSVGQLGEGDTVSHLLPVVVAGGLSFEALAAGVAHTCGLTTGGVAYCWGSNHAGALGTGDTIPRSTPTAVVGGLTFASLTAGLNYTCGLTPAGTAYCWGNNLEDQAGDGIGSGTIHTVPVPVAGSHTFQSLTAGISETCGVAANATAYCWGYLIATEEASDIPVAIGNGLAFRSLVLEDASMCGLTVDSLAYCWGENTNGELGDGTTKYSTVPVQVAGQLTFKSLAAQEFNPCGLRASGVAYCWGLQVGYPLGTTPQSVSGPLRFASLSGMPGGLTVCGVTVDSAAFCWGNNDAGQFGNGVTLGSLYPTAVRSP